MPTSERDATSGRMGSKRQLQAAQRCHLTTLSVILLRPKADLQQLIAMLRSQPALPPFAASAKFEPKWINAGLRNHAENGAADKVAPPSIGSSKARDAQRSTTTFPTVLPSARCAWAAATSSKPKLRSSTTGLRCPASTQSASVLKMSP